MQNLEWSIDKYHEKINANEEPREYLGCSLAGHPCERWLWLSYRWAFKQQFPGRLLRAFRRGHQEERNAIYDLEGAGCRVTARQKEVRLAPGIKGHIDGIITGLPGFSSKERFLLEIKTLNRERFRLAETRGVQNGLPDHWTQIQLYLLGTRLPKALYYGLCKDDERIYTEIIDADTVFASQTVARLSRLIADPRIPPPISTDPSWYQCRGCPAHGFCHHGNAVAQKNCRTCEYASREPDGTWTCHAERFVSGPPTLAVSAQRFGCSSHELHADLRAARRGSHASE